MLLLPHINSITRRMSIYTESLSVPEAVRQIVGNNKIYLQALELGIANYTALAERMKKDVERLVGSKVNLNTIVVAIKRFADLLGKKEAGEQRQQASGGGTRGKTRAKMSLTGSIIDVAFQKEHDDALVEILEEFFGQESKHSLFQTDNHFTLLAEDADEIKNIVANALEKFHGKVMKGLAKITVTVSPDEQNPYLVLSLISNILYNHRIPVHSSFFTSNEMVIVLDDKDAAKAYDLIRTEIG
jgi:hypothetical protein